LVVVEQEVHPKERLAHLELHLFLAVLLQRVEAAVLQVPLLVLMQTQLLAVLVVVAQAAQQVEVA
jgi:hypothetical protein